jgi:DNA-directed RNA polymerase specialized sigma24 family protein
LAADSPLCVSRAGAAGEDVAAETFRVALDARRRFDRSREDAGPWLPMTLAIVPRTAARSAARTPLVRLAADVRLMPTQPQPGDATLVVRYTVVDGSHASDGAVYGGYDLYTDSGQYYYAPDSLAELQQAVDTHQPEIDSGNEAQALNTIAAAANGTPAQAREATLSTFPHGLAPMPTPAEVKAFDDKMERLTKRPIPYVAPTHASYILSQDSDLWIAATQALAVGAGRSDVRAGAMKALSTITGVTQTPTELDGVRALKVDFPDDGQAEIIWLNADTGVPIQEQDGSDSATTFEVERVTAASLPSQISAAARLR